MVAQDPSRLAGSRWQAVEVGSIDVDAGVPSTLAFEPPGRVSGNSGCNRYFGTVEVGAGSVRFGPLAATRMMCPPPRMEQEARFLEALAKAECWRIDDDARLVLADAAGTPLIVFEREQT